MDFNRPLCFLFLTAVIVTALPLDGGITPQLKLITTVEGKSFYADFSEGRSWHAARWYCNSTGMKLASIQTATQLAALANASTSFDSQGSHWVNGRDALAIRQFSWDGSEEPLSEELLYERRFSDSFHSCLMFLPTGPSSFLYSSLCTMEVGIICESYDIS